MMANSKLQIYIFALFSMTITDIQPNTKGVIEYDYPFNGKVNSIGEFKQDIHLSLPKYSLINNGIGKGIPHETLIKPIIWGVGDFSVKMYLEEFLSEKREIHPLDIGKALVYTAYRYQQTGDILFRDLSMGYLELVNNLHSNPIYFDNNTFKYNFSHGEMKTGWWSGMAN